MKKKLMMFILTFLVFIPAIDAATPDTTAPTFNGWSLNSKTYKPGDEIVANINASDDISGLDSFHVTFKTKDGSEEIFLVLYLDKGNVTKYKLPANVKPGTYHLFAGTLIDNASNSLCLVTSFGSSVNNCPNRMDDMTITIEEGSITSKPVISNITVNKSEINVGEEIEISMKITGGSENKSAYVVFENNHAAVNLWRVGNTDIFKGKERINTVGDLIFNNLTVNDGDNTYWQFGLEGSVGTPYTLSKNVLSSILKIKVNGEADSEVPILKNVTINKKEISAPGKIEITVEATDNKGINLVQIDVRRKDKQYPYYSGDIKKSGNKYTMTLYFDQYTDEGEYFIENIFLTDYNNNQSWYCVNSETDKCEKLSYYSFNVIKDKNNDTVISTETKDGLDKINNANDNAIIAIDSTRNSVVKKEIFDAIKGTNKTLYIESNGIEWIFYGKDIVNETKNVDVKVDIYTNEFTDDKLNGLLNMNSLIIEFAKNGLLPGIAKVRIKAEYTFRDYVGEKDLYVYYYDENSELLDPVVEKISITSDGYYEFYLNHNSIYTISSKKASKKYISKNKELLGINKENNGNDNYQIDLDNSDNFMKIDNYIKEEKINKVSKKRNNYMIYIALGAASLAILGVGVFFIIRKHKINKTQG